MKLLTRLRPRWVAASCVLTGLLSLGAAGAAQATVTVTATPALYPTYSSTISDYVIRCTTPPVQVSVNATNGDQVSVDGQTAQTGSFVANVSVTTGQEFPITTTHGNTSNTNYVRCLPTDFAAFTSPVNATNEAQGTPAPQSQFYLTAPIAPSAFGPSPPTTNYVAMFDTNGVPVWWYPTSSVPLFAATKPNGDVVFTNKAGPFDEVTLGGGLVRTITDPNGNQLDFHEYQTLANGDDLVMADTTACCYDFSSWGSGDPSNATIYDQVIEAINPTTHHVDWSWDPAQHIDPVTQTGTIWRSTAISGGSPYDVYHMNGIATNGSSVIVSFRHLNAVYEINKATGNIDWKLGGNPENGENLTVSGDQYVNNGQSLFCGQHDPRVFDPGGLLSDPGATLTVHDNGTNCGASGTAGRQPRAVRFSINPTAKTATEVEQVTDPLETQSVCCGSARKLPGGDWVLGWGHAQFFTELTAGGALRNYELQYTTSGWFSYRVKPVQPGVYTISQLRSGMNTQFPR